MSVLDWTVLIGYFAVMVGIGVWSHARIHSASDFFTAGGRMPWWLSGISHHMSGYSTVMFTVYAAIAYDYGITSYVTWSFPIAVGIAIGSRVWAPRWNRLRHRLGVTSPLEFLTLRYGTATDQALAWTGALLKVVDVGAKWVAIATLLNVFTGISILHAILLTGAITTVYCTVGGLWADALTDFGQFVIQLVAGVVMFVAALAHLGGAGSLLTMWGDLPAEHHHPTTGPYTVTFLLAYLFIKTFEYNGGMWNQAQRYLAATSPANAARAARLSAALWFVWPLVLFVPMWAAPLIVPDVADPKGSYADMVEVLMPQGLLGLVVAGFFSHTMAMCSSDANAIAAVFTRDLLPAVHRGSRDRGPRYELTVGRIATVSFLLLSMVVATQNERFDGIISIVIAWVAALMGPISIPLMLGMLRPFRRCGQTAALGSWAAGLAAFAITKYGMADASTTLQVAAPLFTSLLLYPLLGLLRPEATAERDRLLDVVDGVDAAEQAPAAPAA